MSREVYRHKWMTLLEDEKAFSFVQMQDGAVCIPINEKGEALLISEYSPAYDEPVLVLPGGGITPGEPPIEAANRELQEEIGFKAGRLDFLGAINPLSKYLQVRMHLYLARDLTPSRLQGDEDWDITIIPTALSEVDSLIISGHLFDSSVIAALYMARAFLQKEQDQHAPQD